MMRNLSVTKIIAISIICGLLSGFFALFLAKNYLSNFAAFSDIYAPDQLQLGGKEIVIQEAKKVIVEHDTRVKQIIDRVSPSVFGVYVKRAQVTSPLNAYSVSDQVASALAVTSDGWLVAYMQGVYSPSALVIVVDDVVYNVEKIIGDAPSNIYFLKTSATNLPVVEFAPLENITSGQSIIGYDFSNKSITVQLIEDALYQPNRSKLELVESVENYVPKILISTNASVGLFGRQFFNLSGELVGLGVEGQTAIKAHYVDYLLKTILKEQKIVKPYLGFNYIRAEELYGFNLNSNFGAIVVKNSRGVVVARNSTLADQLKEGDVIVAVEGNQLTIDQSLADYIYDYRIGNTVSLDVVRDGQHLEVKYTLSEVKN